MIPVSNERLWIDKFIAWSFYWVIVGLLESVFVGYIFFLREDQYNNKGRKKKEEDKKANLYDGLRDSVLDPADSLGDFKRPLETVDEQESNESISSNNSTGDTNGSMVPLTLKQQMQQTQQSRNGQNTPPEPTRTLSLCELTPGDTATKKVSGRWKWMYTISLRKLDKFFFFFTLTTYTLFLIAMFASQQYWGKNQEYVWLGGKGTINEA